MVLGFRKERLQWADAQTLAPLRYPGGCAIQNALRLSSGASSEFARFLSLRVSFLAFKCNYPGLGILGWLLLGQGARSRLILLV